MSATIGILNKVEMYHVWSIEEWTTFLMYHWIETSRAIKILTHSLDEDQYSQILKNLSDAWEGAKVRDVYGSALLFRDVNTIWVSLV